MTSYKSAFTRLMNGYKVRTERYNSFTVHKLKILLKARGIKRPRSGTKKDIIKALVRDVEPFPLLELPAELRNMVYEFVLTSPSALQRPAQPALTMACRQVRDEALPLFYSSNVFSFDLRYQYPTSPMAFRAQGLQWLDSITQKNSTHIQKLRLAFGQRWLKIIPGHRTRSSYAEVFLAVSLNEWQRSVEVKHSDTSQILVGERSLHRNTRILQSHEALERAVEHFFLSGSATTDLKRTLRKLTRLVSECCRRKRNPA